MKSHIVQCLACGKIKLPDATWVHKDIDSLNEEISHTYCKDCIQSLQATFFAARSFQKWTFEKQISYLENELDQRKEKHDKLSLKVFLDEFFCISSEDFPRYYEALQHKLAQAICPKCKNEILPGEDNSSLGERIFHNHCYKKLSGKIDIILENEWDLSDKLNAYFDLLKIDKELRGIVHRAIKQRRKSFRATAIN
ncbi:MAG: hypothetical protein HQK83_18195 [Fibrobacteria bacterium]|nr:hypothetical protein [Fibrobacteria bacterium]